MVSKNEIKLITSLQQKKYRNKHRLFVVEGVKSVDEFIHSQYPVYKIYITPGIPIPDHIGPVQEVSANVLKKMSSFKTPAGILGVFAMPEHTIMDTDDLQVVLDGIQDPGNLGTIIRLCDWFGVTQLICSLDTVDCYNPKVVQATMGSLTRVNMIYTDIVPFLAKQQLPIYISKMDAMNVYQQHLDNKAILVMGNEANGISAPVQKLATKSIRIPRFGEQSKAESLNVATATAVLLSEFRRNN